MTVPSTTLIHDHGIVEYSKLIDGRDHTVFRLTIGERSYHIAYDTANRLTDGKDYRQYAYNNIVEIFLKGYTPEGFCIHCGDIRPQVTHKAPAPTKCPCRVLPLLS